jgi:hypothetical protein
MSTDLPGWTAADQARIDAFEQQIVNVASQLQSGHPDAIVMGFVQATGSMMLQRLAKDPTLLSTYLRMIRMLKRQLNQSVWRQPKSHRSRPC